MRRVWILWAAVVSVTLGDLPARAQAPKGSGGRSTPANTQPTREPGAAAKAAQSKAAAPLPDPRRMEALLRQWEAQSAKNHTLDVEFTRVDTSQVWDDKIHYTGRAALKSPNLAFLRFDKIVPPKTGLQPKAQAYEVVMCDGKKVYQFLYETKQVFVYPLDARERQRALQEGPLPFLFNMKSEEAKKRYKFTLLSESEKSFVVQVTPLQAIDRDAFSEAAILVSKTTFMPTQLRLTDPSNGRDTKMFYFKNIQTNAAVKDELFAGEALAQQATTKNHWTRLDNPDAQAAAPAAARPKGAAVGRRATPPSAKPRTNARQ